MIHVTCRALAYLAENEFKREVEINLIACGVMMQWGPDRTRPNFIGVGHVQKKIYDLVPTCPTCAVLWDLAMEGGDWENGVRLAHASRRILKTMQDEGSSDGRQDGVPAVR